MPVLVHIKISNGMEGTIEFFFYRTRKQTHTQLCLFFDFVLLFSTAYGKRKAECIDDANTQERFLINVVKFLLMM